MILVDFSQTCINVLTGVGSNPDNNYYDTAEQLSKHIIFNKLLTYNQTFAHKYGQMVICLEGKNNWRYGAFPLYKHKRKTSKKESTYIDWNHLYEVMNSVIIDLKENFPYALLSMEGCEADDILATLAKYVREQNVIVSSDKDFNQLLGLSNVDQYDPRKGVFLKLETTPENFLLEHILKGDVSDGIPNILSPDDIFLQEGVRQKSITSKYKAEFADRLRRGELREEEIKNFARNDKLINLNSIPKNIKLAILELYSNYVIEGDHEKLLNFLIKHQYQGLIEYVNEF